MRYGVRAMNRLDRQTGLAARPRTVINTLSLDELLAWLASTM